MCGITGFIGQGDITEALLNGLERLEYRGYDSAGICTVNPEGQVRLFKAAGPIQALRDKVEADPSAHAGIGHTRWATHGVANETNAHPHQSADGRFSLVHNGVIENYQELKAKYLADYPFKSQTDTEVVVALIAYFADKDQLTGKEAFLRTLEEIEGSYAFVLLDKTSPDHLYAAKNKSPLLLGLVQGFNCLVSDAMAAIQLTDQYLEIHDGEVIDLEAANYHIQDANGQPIQRQAYTARLNADDLEKGTYPYYMLKEIDEQPAVLRRIVQAYSNDQGQLVVDPDILAKIQASDRLYIIAAGTSMHAGLMGKALIEKLAQIPVEVCIASEFAYARPLLSEKPYFIYISQSGETADSRQVLVQTNAEGYPSLTITNTPGSTLSREADDTLLLHAGPEIAVASTKAYTAQIAVLAILADALAQAQGKDLSFDMKQELGRTAQAMEAAVSEKDHCHDLARQYFTDQSTAFYIGRSLDYYSSLEAALKLKEISYIQAEGFAAGELKHGTIALIEEGTPVIAMITQEQTAAMVRSNVEEVRSRGAQVIHIASENCQKEGDQLLVMQVEECLLPLVSIVYAQLLAYYATIERGYDVDKPRNLAKSVTVE
ncbi:glutamine--fructose-6-phosphate transaminase (isomerizing) [Aerococcus sp. UMB8623]|uniref:glutamine--fructose-6-phosphate transaminase (isomerizing) n=1 Tax=Aerococcus sp. UMB8623 TaxID=3046348 RepID=UPI002550762A|nr:glutamine--fructose-6-phosphate transaminase (isomerizing) [Aerococcus sp. UMB8623]MDK6686381.1 glutamine--fructose-6-phosphate transaminase (isomerizing) [Aerococcus sp. UMB8623]